MLEQKKSLPVARAEKEATEGSHFTTSGLNLSILPAKIWKPPPVGLGDGFSNIYIFLNFF
jgi:hypothetical protein